MFETTERAHQVKAFDTKHDDLSSICRAQMVKEKDYSCKWSSAWVHITHTHAHRHAHTPTHMCTRTHTEVHTHTKETNVIQIKRLVFAYIWQQSWAKE